DVFLCYGSEGKTRIIWINILSTRFFGLNLIEEELQEIFDSNTSQSSCASELARKKMPLWRVIKISGASELVRKKKPLWVEI
uniref:Uncharacterized protein n=1 Tax=Cucumis melo TaxID=3656 RepID=A0A9I9ELP1_CUCME